MTSPVINFGRHRGQTVDQIPDDYVRWLADPVRTEQQADRKFPPLPADVVEAARERLKKIDENKMREDFAKLCLGGHPTGFDEPIYIIECEGDCYSKSGAYAIDYQWFKSLDETLAYLATEFPIEDRDDFGGEIVPVRSTPDPEDDRIIVWEVIPSGHRKPIWGFFGWHYSSSADEHACGQGTLPGDKETLHELAMREY